GPYVDQWWNDAASFDSATPVNLVAGVATTGIDAQLVVAGAITGTVTDRAAHPVEGVCVQATTATVFRRLARTDSQGRHYRGRGRSSGAEPAVIRARSCRTPRRPRRATAACGGTGSRSSWTSRAARADRIPSRRARTW